MTPSTAKVVESSLPARLDKAQRELAACRAQTERSSTITLVLGLIVLLALGGYFAYGYMKINELLEPKGLVLAGDAMVKEHLPEAQQNLEKRIVASAPQWSQNLSKQLFQAVPQLREKLENVVLEQVTTNLNEAQILSEQHFQAFLKDNRDLINGKLEELATSEKLTKDSLQQVQDALEKSLGGDMKEQARAMLDGPPGQPGGLRSLAKRMQRLAANKQLTYDETVERRLVTLIRAMQMQKVDPELSTPEPAATDTVAVKSAPRAASEKRMPKRPGKKEGKPEAAK